MTYKDSLRSTMVTHYFRMDGEAPRSEYWWFFVTYILATIATGVLAAVVAVAGDVDVLLVAHWGAWTLLVVFFLPMVSLWIRRCRALGQSPGQSLTILAVVLVLSFVAPLGGMNPVAASLGAWDILLDGALIVAMLYSVWVGLRSKRSASGPAKD